MPELSLLTNPLQFFFYVISLLAAITVHEFAHALAADRLGDPTPRSQGRLTLNPLPHLDLIGTAALFLVGFGWGKPVQFDPYNLSNPKRDAAIISFAGPASNILFAILFSLITRAMLFIPQVPSELGSFMLKLSLPFIFLNIILAIFNLIPIHPLDGGKILIGLLPDDIAQAWDHTLNQYGIFILLILILPLFGGGTPIVWKLIGPTIQFLTSLLLPFGGFSLI